MKQNLRTLTFLSSLMILSACQRSAFDPARVIAETILVPSSSMSKIVVSDNNIADGISPADVRIQLLTDAGLPVPNVVLNLNVSGSENVIVPCLATDAEGRTRCTVYSTKAERKRFLTWGSVTLSAEKEFAATKPFRSSFAFVATGDQQLLPSGHRIVAVSGLNETSTTLQDANGFRRAHTSVLGSLLAD